tara:strand:+ start:544 stop:1449 length:906 start_codon:yes stop_codon:yes gene_type:complete
VPAASKQQQKFMGIVRSIQKGDVPASKFSKAAQKAAKSMTKKSVKKYAATKHDELPNKIKELYDSILNENPAAIAAAQRMVVQAKSGNKVSVNTARQSSYAKKDPSTHKKAKSLFQRIKDRFKKREGVNEAPDDFIDKDLSTDDLLRRKKYYLHENRLDELTSDQVIALQLEIALNRADKIIKDVIKTEVAKRDRKKALEIMKLYKRYFVEFSARVKASNPIKDNVNEVKDPDVIAKIRDVVKNKQNQVIKDPVTKRKMRMDGFSASAIIQVYDAINNTNKKKFAKLPILKMQSIAFKFVK